MTTRSRPQWSLGLVVAVMMSYATVTVVCFGAGYALGRLLL